MAKKSTKTRKQTPIQKEYAKQVSRIKAFIRRAEKRGYRFEKDIVPAKPKRITKASVRKLKEIKPITLYKKSTYLSESGDIVSGVQGRKEERSNAAKKGLQKKKYVRGGMSNDPDYEKWLEDRRKKDEEEKKKLRKEKIRELFTKGNIIYNNILDLLSDIDKQHQKAAEKLRKLLEAQINEFEKEKVMLSIAQNESEVMELVDITLRYNPGDDRHDTAIRELYTLFKGEIPTSQDMKDLQDTIDADISYDESHT